MLHGLVNELKKISETKRVFHYIQNNSEFLSIVLMINSDGLNVFVSVQQSVVRTTKTKMDKKIKLINDERRVFSDGSSFDKYFKDDKRLGKF